MSVPKNLLPTNTGILKTKHCLTDAEAKTPTLWPPEVKSQHIGKDPDAGKDRRQEKGMSEGDEMVGWRHGLHGPEFERVPGDGEDRGACHASVHGIAKCRIQLSN